MSTHQKKHKKNIATKEFIKEKGEEYAVIIKSLGKSFECQLHSTNEIIQATARGSLKRGPGKQLLMKDDIVLVQADSSTTTKVKYFITHKYSKDDIKRLHKAGELTQKKVDEEKKGSVSFGNDVIGKKHQEEVVDDFYKFIEDL